jgi:hypothetical protein
MTEPLYTFIKGQGWVLQYPRTVTMHCGTVVTIEMRKPKPGEYWNAAFHDDYNNLDFWYERAKSSRFQNLSKDEYTYDYTYVVTYTTV